MLPVASPPLLRDHSFWGKALLKSSVNILLIIAREPLSYIKGALRILFVGDGNAHSIAPERGQRVPQSPTAAPATPTTASRNSHPRNASSSATLALAMTVSPARKRRAASAGATCSSPAARKTRRRTAKVIRAVRPFGPRARCPAFLTDRSFSSPAGRSGRGHPGPGPILIAACGGARPPGR